MAAPKVYSAAAGDLPLGHDRFDHLFKKYASRESINWLWLKAIAWNESTIGNNARVLTGQVSSDGKSWGIMQLTLPTARQFAPNITIEKLNDPDTSIDIASRLLAWLLVEFKGDLSKAVKAYNQGIGNTKNGKNYADSYFAKFQTHLFQLQKG